MPSASTTPQLRTPEPGPAPSTTAAPMSTRRRRWIISSSARPTRPWLPADRRRSRPRASTAGGSLIGDVTPPRPSRSRRTDPARATPAPPPPPDRTPSPGQTAGKRHRRADGHRRPARSSGAVSGLRHHHARADRRHIPPRGATSTTTRWATSPRPPPSRSPRTARAPARPAPPPWPGRTPSPAPRPARPDRLADRDRRHRRPHRDQPLQRDHHRRRSQAYTAEGFDASGNSLGDVTAITTFSIAPDGSARGRPAPPSPAGSHTVTGNDAGQDQHRLAERDRRRARSPGALPGLGDDHGRRVAGLHGRGSRPVRQLARRRDRDARPSRSPRTGPAPARPVPPRWPGRTR